MHPSHHAQAAPDRPAVIVAETGETVTYAQLEARSNQGAHLIRALGLNPGDVIAILLENHPSLFDIAWAAQRSGVYCVAISSRLTAAEVSYILRDSGAKLLVTSAQVAEVAGITGWEQNDTALMMIGATTGAWRSWDSEISTLPVTPIADERAGGDMLYSSGTTGHPKGIKAPLPVSADIAEPTPLAGIAQTAFGFNADTVYLCPAPLYHAAPLRWSMSTQRLGGTVVIMQKFDAEAALATVEKYKVTHSQWVPTHFVRMLKLPPETRRAYDLSSLRLAIHAAAPCPVPVKHAMIEWWGPILVEYYAGTEGNGMTIIDTANWLSHPGSVGKPVAGKLHILDDEDRAVSPRTEGHVYFEGGAEFEYHNDPEKTAETRNSRGWSTLGDIGWIDEEGYLYLTDRKSFMIISGGVNIYPQEIENLLITHPKVADVAVIGIPDTEMGEKVVAVVQPVDWSNATPAFAAELTEWARKSLSGVKIPRQIDFREALPRHDTGKLFKRLLSDEYRAMAHPDLA